MGPVTQGNYSTSKDPQGITTVQGQYFRLSFRLRHCKHVCLIAPGLIVLCPDTLLAMLSDMFVIDVIVWRLRLRSGSAHCDLPLAVEVR